MIRNWFKYLLPSIGLVLGLGACSGDDDDKAEVPTPAPKLQVMAVFAPGQLGDQGYADRVLKGVNALKKVDEDADSVEVGFIASYDVVSTRYMISEWLSERESPVDGAPYSRRLLVLTEPFMVKWLTDVSYMLKATDEILLLKANDDDVQAAADTLDMAGRVHGLNISAAASVRHAEDAHRLFFRMKGLNDEQPTFVMRLYSEGVVNYRDSIYDVIREENPGKEVTTGLNIFKEEGEIYNTDFQATAFQMAYDYCALAWGLANSFDSSLFAIVDYGAANSGAEFFLMGGNVDMRIIMIMLDAESNTSLKRFAITRHFDRAVSGWTRSWLAQPAGTMPQMEVHGGWAGYCTDDIDPMAFF